MKKYPVLFLLLSLLVALSATATQLVSSARVWPAPDYTRITLESSQPFQYKMMEIKNPDRIVLDIENINLNESLKSLASKVAADDPYIQQIRVGNYQPGVVRMVVDLKAEVKPKAFTLTPAGEYQHRLVLDIYPPKDALMTMLDNREKPSTDANQHSNVQIEHAEQKPAHGELPTELKTEAPKTEASKALGSSEEPQTPADNTKNTEQSSPNAAPKEKNKNQRLITIAIDAGHGGEDPGARGANGSHEKNITLKIAKKLNAAIDAEPNMQGVLTRDGDYFIPLHGRVVKARNSQADLFVSIHADAFTTAAARGSSVFALSERGATSASARYLAKKENESDLIGGVSLDDKDPWLARTLLDLSQTATINDSLKLGKAVLSNIGQINRLHKNHVEQAGFAVLKSPDIPSILVETAFISNPEEERKLNDDEYQDKLAASILSGIKKYFSTNPALAKAK